MIGPGQRFPSWRGLTGSGRPEPRGYPFFTTADLRAAGLPPEGFLRRERARRTIMSVARGCHVARPEDADARWSPDADALAWLIAVARQGTHGTYVSGISAAALHGAARRPSGVVHVTVPRQMRARELPALGFAVVFHQRNEHCLGLAAAFCAVFAGATLGPDLEWRTSELATFRLSSPGQTLLDLDHEPRLASLRSDHDRVRSALGRQVDHRTLLEIASVQRRRRAWERAHAMRR